MEKRAKSTLGQKHLLASLKRSPGTKTPQKEFANHGLAVCFTVSGGAIQTSAWVQSRVRPGPIPGPKGPLVCIGAEIWEGDERRKFQFLSPAIH